MLWRRNGAGDVPRFAGVGPICRLEGSSATARSALGAGIDIAKNLVGPTDRLSRSKSCASVFA